MKNNDRLKTILKLFLDVLLIQIIRHVVVNTLFLIIPHTKFYELIITTILLIILNIIIIKYIRKNIIKINLFNENIKEFYLMFTAISVIFMLIVPSYFGGSIVYNVLYIIYFTVISAMFEELLFRGIIYSKLTSLFKNELYVFIITTIMYTLWGLCYIDMFVGGYEQASVNTVLVSKLISSLVIGLVCGFLRYKCKSTYLSILANNVLKLFIK